MARWEDLTSDYNVLDFSFEEDAQAAFTGIENILECSFPAGFLHGLPEFFFDWVLVWQSHTQLERRTVLNARNGYRLPSWSWLGWKGEISQVRSTICGSYWRDLNNPIWTLMEVGYRMEPLVDWVQIGPSQDQQRRIRNDWHKWLAHRAPGLEVPAGWSVHGDEEDSWYTTDSAPGVFFRQPLPTVGQLPPDAAQKCWPPYLRLRSFSAFFKVTSLSSAAENEAMKGDETRVQVSDLNGREAGVLFLDRLIADETIIGHFFELVTISRGRMKPVTRGTKDWFPEYYLKDITKTDGVLEFYNVLFIKW